jgi:TrmH family RNA methyltransferase
MLTGDEGAGRIREDDSSPGGAPDLDEFRALARRDHRDRTGRYVVEGARFVHEALRTRTPVEGALVCRELLDAGAAHAVAALERRAVPVRCVTRDEYASFSTAQSPSGVALVVAQRWTAPRRPTGGESPLWLALGGVRSPGNLGTILRTARAAGAAGALFLDPATDPFHPTTVRGSMGAVLALPLMRMTAGHFVAWKRRTGTLVVGTSSEARRDFRDVPLRRPTVVMLGCERRGMSRAQRRACDVTVSIPMAPGCDSLNVAVAAGIVLFAVRCGPRRSRN